MVFKWRGTWTLGFCGLQLVLSNVHGFILRDYIRDYAKLQEGPYVHYQGSPQKSRTRTVSCRDYTGMHLKQKG